MRDDIKIPCRNGYINAVFGDGMYAFAFFEGNVSRLSRGIADSLVNNALKQTDSSIIELSVS